MTLSRGPRTRERSSWLTQDFPGVMATPDLQGPVSIKVQVPNMQDKTEWKLNGQVLVFTLPLTDQVRVAAPNWPQAQGHQGLGDTFSS